MALTRPKLTMQAMTLVVEALLNSYAPMRNSW
jgi:hypothetical protein